MKTAFATIACVLIAGLATAQTMAEVTGNNTAVVITKTAVESSNGYQFLCVPVDALDITGSTTSAGVALNDLFPPANYADGMSLKTVTGTSSADVTYTKSSDGWKKGEEAAGTEKIPGGTILWLSAPQQSAQTAALMDASTPASVVFCGQARTSGNWTRTAGMTAMKNDSSEAIKISAIADKFATDNKPQVYDRILLVQQGSSDYKYFSCGKNGTTWYSGSSAVTDADTIAAGEAFYYYAKAQN